MNVNGLANHANRGSDRKDRRKYFQGFDGTAGDIEMKVQRSEASAEVRAEILQEAKASKRRVKIAQFIFLALILFSALALVFLL